jgi:hypothetical protein
MFNRVLLAGAAVLLLNGSAAVADLMTLQGMALNETVQTHISGTLADGLTVYAGQEQLTYQGTNYLGYCVDLNHYANTCQVSEVSAVTWANGNKLVYLYDTYAPTITTDLQAAALQTAIWEVISEPATGPFDVTNGTFYITGNSSVATLANQMLATMPSTYTPGFLPTILTNSSNQDFLIGKWEPVGNPVPEPCTLALMAAGAGLFLVVRRRKHRSAAATSA